MQQNLDIGAVDTLYLAIVIICWPGIVRQGLKLFMQAVQVRCGRRGDFIVPPRPRPWPLTKTDGAIGPCKQISLPGSRKVPLETPLTFMCRGNQGGNHNPASLRSEKVAAVLRNTWPLSIGMRGRDPSDWVATFSRNDWPRSFGLAGRNQRNTHHVNH